MASLATLQNDPQASSPAPHRRILGVRVDDVTWAEALAAIDGFIASGVASGRSGVASSRPHHVVTPNPELVMRAQRDPAFRAVIERADLAPADGVGLKWAGRLLGRPIREVVPGSDLIERMAERAPLRAAVRAGVQNSVDGSSGNGSTIAAPRAERWFLLGGAEGVADAVAAALTARHPGIEIAGTWSGSPRVEEEDEICRRIEAARPVDVLFVAYGSPAQEMWIARNQPRLRIPVAIGVGGGFNFVAGRSRRAPGWVKRMHVIWLFRLITEPWRWRRQVDLVRFGALVAREAVAARVSGRIDMKGG